MIGQHAPLAGRSAAKVDRDEMQLIAAGRHQPGHRPQEEGAAANQRRRDEPALDQLRIAVEIREDRLHQLGALLDAGRNALPLCTADQQRNGRDRPGAFLTFADDAEAGADILGMALRALARMAEVIAGDRRQFLEHRGPGRIVMLCAEHVALELLAAIVRDPPRGMRARIKQGRRGKGGHGIYRSRPAGSRLGYVRAMIIPRTAR